eukprot:c29067_g1_i1.p1 GENE.c29067_g1_i1~~c29067_g1_i1.p1  ORF type:complete len:107 (+),score=16.97 c29067_g1_i1:510-830(+)
MKIWRSFKAKPARKQPQALFDKNNAFWAESFAVLPTGGDMGLMTGPSWQTLPRIIITSVTGRQMSPPSLMANNMNKQDTDVEVYSIDHKHPTHDSSRGFKVPLNWR